MFGFWGKANIASTRCSVRADIEENQNLRKERSSITPVFSVYL